MKYFAITEQNEGVKKFLKFTKLMDLIVVQQPISNSDFAYCSVLLKKTFFLEKNQIFDIYRIVLYLAIKYDFNSKNIYLDDQKTVITNLKKAKSNFIKELIQFYNIEILALYIVKLKYTFFKSNLFLCEFFYFDYLLNNFDLSNYNTLQDVVFKGISAKNLFYSEIEKSYSEEDIKDYFSDVTFILDQNNEINFLKYQKPFEMPLAVMGFEDSMCSDIQTETIYRMLVNFYLCYKQ